jgi:hypothetical protein
MFNKLNSLGITIPLLATLMLYAIGIVYNVLYYKQLGYSGYCGAMPINDVLLINLHSLGLIGAIFANLVGFIYLNKKKSVTDELMCVDHKSPNLDQVINSYEAVAKIGKVEKIFSITVFILLLIFALYLLFSGNYMNLSNIVLGGIIALILKAAYMAKIYDTKWTLLVVCTVIILTHSAISGMIDADGIRRNGKIVSLETQDVMVKGRFVGEDNSYVYLITEKESLQVSKANVKTLIW